MCIEHEHLPFALDLLKKLIKQFPSNIDLIFQAGQVCEKTGDLEGALKYFKAADLHDAYSIEAKLKIARIMIGQNKVIQADSYINQVLKKDPKNEDALSLRRLF